MCAYVRAMTLCSGSDWRYVRLLPYNVINNLGKYYLLQAEVVFGSGDHLPTMQDFLKNVDKARSSFSFGDIVRSVIFGKTDLFISIVRGICDKKNVTEELMFVL